MGAGDAAAAATSMKPESKYRFLYLFIRAPDVDVRWPAAAGGYWLVRHCQCLLFFCRHIMGRFVLECLAVCLLITLVRCQQNGTFTFATSGDGGGGGGATDTPPGVDRLQRSSQKFALQFYQVRCRPFCGGGRVRVVMIVIPTAHLTVRVDDLARVIWFKFVVDVFSCFPSATVSVDP